MFISLQISNVDRLPAGTSASYAARDRSFEIGRENCDWTLSDPDKFISGRHCEVRYQAGSFWLYDVSRNGTFVNGSRQRMAGPHRLAQGDRLLIGRYVVSVSVEDERAATGHPQARTGSTQRELPPATGRPLDFGPQPSFNPAGQRPPEAAASTSSALPPGPGAVPANRPAEADAMLHEIARAAGIAPELLKSRDPHDVAAEIGAVLRTTVEQLSLLLKARAAAKVLAKSANRTMIGAEDNNPLKFVPGTDDILEIMFAKRRTGYLDAKHSIEDAFRDLKTHEIATYAAMQAALSRLLDDLSPEAIAKKIPPASFSSRKSQAWDALVATWRTMEDKHENGMLDVFLAYFADAYAKAGKQK
ncbi:type VI secretion system-associated FHA domain protein TagH [Mesorhizobium sp. M2D.F.Ca.ET.185.01.1.1]|uniref:type VI secretion system-associated FHA domain protein TagH n=1 Tax=unclassified Mesorhizobium TaxID=325217 RepID=UPI000FCBA18B|nr:MULTISPECIES: type VI secretion system-associated FHA domain protein TagH [unclassified Mesorhizobium]TGP74964.1 type VI secretion system-associated FHA domain protein TagH [bacterium M00.F.Ca.ET.227.01.1.1]TGP85291.1 type VI secretion system-associated FHA domain protein TagH [bacterium M00.F.Ca.ET.221.01.1.1]TGP89717.1 type VI secretion system-associated FHA domain protein TagH [bacterium M00.F.Ca.ET.222.01.1.1]TGU05720.1 type VI secretion system-associated FHA domain protein TagH [bacteri